MTPGRKPSTITSADVASRRKISCPSGAFMLSAIERLLRLTNAWMVRRTHCASWAWLGSGVSIFSTSAPMSASIMPGISAGGTRASSRILIPSRTPTTLLLRPGQPRGQGADVRNVLQAGELRGDVPRLVGAEHRSRAAQELRAQLLVAERLVGVTGGAARGRLERAPVAQPHRHAAPGVLLEAVGEPRIDHHPHAPHQVARAGVDRSVLERGDLDAAGGQRRRRAELHRE